MFRCGVAQAFLSTLLQMPKSSGERSGLDGGHMEAGQKFWRFSAHQFWVFFGFVGWSRILLPKVKIRQLKLKFRGFRFKAGRAERRTDAQAEEDGRKRSRRKRTPTDRTRRQRKESDLPSWTWNKVPNLRAKLTYRLKLTPIKWLRGLMNHFLEFKKK